MDPYDVKSACMAMISGESNRNEALDEDDGPSMPFPFPFAFAFFGLEGGMEAGKE